MKMREFTAVYQKKEEWYIAWVEELPGAHTQGKTLREAKENLLEATQLILEANRAIARHSSSRVRRESFRVGVPA
jgi:predicted RNase H-like HicB family nuclease